MVGGELVTALADATGAQLIPVDSEHSALLQLLASERPGTVDRLVLTASGGPFRGRQDLAGITPEEALAHPTWDMGGKITIDSATLMNKGLELIEAHHLFGVAYEQIDVVVHPQSIIHAIVHLNDGASLAHLGYPDMRVPISYALHYPDRADVPVETLDLAAVGSLTFEPPDLETFACLRLAREAALAGGTAPCTLNAANEVAVHAFLRGEIPFTGIAERDRADAGAAPRAAGAPLLRPVRGGHRGARDGQERAGRVSWFLAFVGFALLIILHELGPLRCGQGGRHARGEVLALLPADPREQEGRRDRVRDRRDPCRGLREDQRDEPGRGPPRRGPDAGLLLAAGVEADRGDRRGPRSEPGACLRAAVHLLLGDRAAGGDIAGGRGREGLPGGQGAEAGRRADRRRRCPWRQSETRGPDRAAPLLREAGGRVQGHDAGDPAGRARRSAPSRSS